MCCNNSQTSFESTGSFPVHQSRVYSHFQNDENNNSGILLFICTYNQEEWHRADEFSSNLIWNSKTWSRCIPKYAPLIAGVGTRLKRFNHLNRLTTSHSLTSIQSILHQGCSTSLDQAQGMEQEMTLPHWT